MRLHLGSGLDYWEDWVNCDIDEGLKADMYFDLNWSTYPNGAGGYSKIANDAVHELEGIMVGEKQTNGKCFGRLRQRISFLLKDNEATEQEIEQVYNHILMEMLK